MMLELAMALGINIGNPGDSMIPTRNYSLDNMISGKVVNARCNDPTRIVIRTDLGYTLATVRYGFEHLIVLPRVVGKLHTLGPQYFFVAGRKDSKGSINVNRKLASAYNAKEWCGKWV